MSKLKRPWGSFVRYMIYNYPALCREEKHIHDAMIISANGGTSDGRLTDKPTDAALRELPEAKRRQLEAVRQAIATVKATRNGKAKIEVLDLYYWKKSHKLYGAALKIGVSVHTATVWNTEFIDLVAKIYGLI